MKLWKQFKSLIATHHDPCPGCRVRLQLTGEPPCNPAECLIKEILGEDKSVPLHWLEERISQTLYHAELRRGAWLLDAGVWGRALFRLEAARTLAGVRREFASLTASDSAKPR